MPSRCLLGIGLLVVALAAGPARATPVRPRAKVPVKPAPRKASPPPPAPLPVLEPRVPARPGDPREQRIARLREQVQDLLRRPPLSRLRLGIEVADVESGDVLLQYNAKSAFNPASNTKILTTAAAMKFLGSDWRYRTLLLQGPPRPEKTASLVPPAPAPPSVLRADLFLQGSGDPLLTSRGLLRMARALARAGITRIEGDLICDGQFRPLEELLRTGTAPAAAGGGALLVNRNLYTVRVSPGAPGRTASVTLEPRSSYFILDARVQTVRGKRARILVDHFRRDGHLVVTVRGRIGAQHKEVVERRRVPDGGALAGVMLAQALSDLGIELAGQVRVGPPPPGPLRLLAEHESPLSEVCKLSNKDSNNFVADLIFKTLGGERFGLPGTLEKGARAVAEWLRLLHLDPARVRIVNGSGLTHENRVRPDDLTRLLLNLYHDIEVAPEFLQSLAIGGVDGTIRYRFRGGTVGLVRAKTGTLSGVSALSGYVGERQGVLAFAILVEGFREKRLDEVRHAQVLIVESLMRFLRQEKETPGLPPRPGADAPPASDGERDSESDGEPL